MRSKLIIDGNAVYEIDEDCVQRKNREKTCNMEKSFEEQSDKKRKKEEKRITNESS